MTRHRPQEPHMWGSRLGMRQASVQILTLLPANRTALGKSLKLLHLENEGFGKDCILPSHCELLGGRCPSPLQPWYPPPFQTLSRYSLNIGLVYTEWLWHGPALKFSFSLNQKEKRINNRATFQNGNRIYLLKINENSFWGPVFLAL